MNSRYRDLKRWGIVLLLTVVAGPVFAQADSLEVLEASVEASPKDGARWARLGHAYLAADSVKAAERAFKKGIDLSKLAAAYHGLAEVYLRRCREGPVKLYCLRVAPNLKQAIKRDSTYAPAYLSLASWYADSGYEDRTVSYYERYFALRPEDLEGQAHLARMYAQLRRNDRVLALVEPALASHPNDTRFLPLAGQVYAARGEADRSLELFRKYLELIPAKERVLYENLSLVASPEDREAYRKVSGAAREAFLERFWRKRDLTLVSGGRMRLAEHYRRVWYARTYFADNVQPWDRRGELYIRYGEPAYRSRSDRVNALPSPAAALVKERNAFDIYEVGANPLMEDRVFDIEVGTGPAPSQELAEQEAGVAPPGLASRGPSELSWAWMETRADGQQYWRKPPDIANERWIEPVFPVDRAPDGTTRVPWESWVYTRVAGGVEFVFVDQVGNGRWQFPALPVDASNSRLVSLATAHDPGFVLQKMAEKTPEYYDVPPSIEPLTFYYDVATFRGEDGRTAVEVYFGIPPGEMTVGRVRGQHLVLVERTMALSDGTGEEIYRARNELTLAVSPASLSQRGAFIPDLVSLDVPPGDYRLAVQLADRASRKWGVYLQDVTVPDYRDAPAMSDLELAWTVSDRDQAGKFRKGDVWVVPMPSRNYQNGQNPYVYYEVYNLQQDTFGQTRYQVEYAIRHHIRREATLVGVIARGFDRLFSSKKPKVVVSYEREGTEASEPIYFELDTRKLKPGLNQIEVRVTDLNAGKSMSKRAIFRMDHTRER